jgi:putative SOS response-associated peptidase YedK
MCGRAAYSTRTVDIAAQSLGASHSCSAGATDTSAKEQQSSINTSPGHTSHVFRRHPSSNQAECIPMIWGLIPQHGTEQSPHHLPSDPGFASSPHYKMFNARSETLYEKRSFSGLMRNGQTCIFAVDGYYEWTS